MFDLQAPWKFAYFEKCGPTLFMFLPALCVWGGHHFQQTGHQPGIIVANPTRGQLNRPVLSYLVITRQDKNRMAVPNGYGVPLN